ncbi:putative zinc metalloprotease EGY2, chloroplastic [Bidens hawaiensis]|uniref:putative zinc metalloprotease EGY2, chloroplastic n=1 Tax=Bidens hawaiensis TaxID=980011 RepID=UPI004049419C
MTSAWTMITPACFCQNFVPQLQCCDLRLQPCVSWLSVRGNRVVKCRATETETRPDGDKDKGQPNQLEILNRFLDSTKAQGLNEDKGHSTHFSQLEALNRLLNKDGLEAKHKQVIEETHNIEITNGSHLPYVKPHQLDGIITIPSETIEILKERVFGFDTFFITSRESYQRGVLFKGNLRGSPAVSYKKMEKRLQDTFGDEYKLFLLVNPEDDKPVAVVVPRNTLLPETTGVPEWFAAGAFGLVTICTLLLHNVPALQSNLLSVFDNIDLLKDGLPGALVTALVLGVHEITHILVARSEGVKLGVPYFVPSWQVRFIYLVN